MQTDASTLRYIVAATLLFPPLYFHLGFLGIARWGHPPGEVFISPSRLDLGLLYVLLYVRGWFPSEEEYV
jgi:hypothetical protein